MKKYRIAIYIRLSKEDDKCKAEASSESSSITTQRILLNQYAAEHFEDYELFEFCDDGYTGTNFERPGMQAMLEEVRNGVINCVIVKDFSRFARDYIELGAYLEQIFPFLGVRFISVNDNYDSSNYKGSIADIDVNFKNLLYDLYSKDLSGKVRSSLAVRKEKGQYVSGNSPFGYEKDPKDRHALLIAEDEAEVVRQIFSLAVQGHTSIEITRMLNEAHVKTPIEFKIEKGQTSRIPKAGRFLWNTSTICAVLRNEIYIGNIVQKKYYRDTVGGKNHIKPREEWMITYNHHEPIIDKEVFDKVQEGRGKKVTPQYRSTHPLVGKLVCGCCKKNLAYRRGLNPYFTCGYRYANTMEQCVIKVNAMFMEQYVLFMMQDKLSADGELKRLHMERTKRLKQEIKELKEKRKDLEAGIEKLKQQNFAAYQNYAAGRADSFRPEKSMQLSIEKELKSLNENLETMEENCNHMKTDMKKPGAESQFAELAKEMIGRYIEKVEVYDEHRIEIYWKENRKTEPFCEPEFAVI